MSNARLRKLYWPFDKLRINQAEIEYEAIRLDE
jgi:hypothetical protein